MSDDPASSREFTLVGDLGGEFAERVVEAFHRRPAELFSLALTGGAVAAACYERLAGHAETQIDWWRVELFLADECLVGPDHDDSHERLVRLLLLDRVGAAHLVYPLRDEASAGAASAVLSQRRLDVVHLVLGADGRLNSFFPGGAHRGAAVVRTADPAGVVPHERLSIGAEVVDRAALVVVTASGASVAEALDAVRKGADVPGNALRAARVEWLVDAAAGGG